MNIFIDTSVIYKDPYWKGNFFNELIEIVKEKEIGLYISKVVLLEIERNYGKIIDKEELNLKKVNSQIEHYQIRVNQTSLINKIESLQSLKSHYDQLIEDKVITVLDYSNDMLPEIVNRAVNRKKPFTETKTELKDALIWLTYAQFAEKENLKECVLLTSNVSDFCDKEKLKQGIFEIDSELQKDSKLFKVYKSPKELIQKEGDILQSIDQRFRSWIEEECINNEYVLELILQNFEDEIKKEVKRKFADLDLDNVFDGNDYYLDGYVNTGNIDVLEVDEIEIDIFNEDSIISGIVFIDCDVEGYQYNIMRDKGEDKYRYYGELTSTCLFTFSFYYDKSKTPKNIELNDFMIKSRH
jgi:predicted nucleic acid-binding protein